MPHQSNPNEMHSTFEFRVFGTAPPGIECRPRRAAYAVIAGTDGRVAAIRASQRDGAGRYWLPGGGMEEEDASPQATVIREVREELGRGVQVQDVVGKVVQFFYASDEDRWYEMRATFLRAVLDESTGAGGEYELHWVDGKYVCSMISWMEAGFADFAFGLIQSMQGRRDGRVPSFYGLGCSQNNVIRAAPPGV